MYMEKTYSNIKDQLKYEWINVYTQKSHEDGKLDKIEQG